MMIWSVAWKNIWRNRTRSLVVIVAIALGLTGGLFSGAVMKGTSDARIREAISRETSHIQIHNPLYIGDNDVRFTINDSTGRLGQMLDTLKGIGSWSPRTKFTAMAASASAATGVMVTGVDPQREAAVTEIHSLICDTCGSWFGECRGTPVVIGKALAKKLKVKLHSKIVLTFQDMQGNLTGTALRICGIYRTSNSVFDEMNIYVGQKEIIPLLAAEPGCMHEIAILLSDAGQMDAIQQTLSRAFPGLLVRTWITIDPLVGLLNNLLDFWMYLFVGIILAALAFGIVNTMLMAILERTRELGMLAAIGMSKQNIFLMVMLESVFLSVTGGILGVALGYGITLWFGWKGINLGAFTEGFEKLGYNPVMYPALEPVFLFNITVMVILTGILASVAPARRALRLNPADAIRND